MIMIFNADLQPNGSLNKLLFKRRGTCNCLGVSVWITCVCDTIWIDNHADLWWSSLERHTKLKLNNLKQFITTAFGCIRLYTVAYACMEQVVHYTMYNIGNIRNVTLQFITSSYNPEIVWIARFSVAFKIWILSFRSTLITFWWFALWPQTGAFLITKPKI